VGLEPVAHPTRARLASQLLQARSTLVATPRRHPDSVPAPNPKCADLAVVVLSAGAMSLVRCLHISFSFSELALCADDDANGL
jgi:hypothetical protein